MKKLVVSVVVILAILGIAFAAYSSSNSKNPTTNNTTNTTTGTSNVNVSNTTPTNTQTTNTTSKNTQSIISPTEAQEIATKYIEQAGITAGTPELMNESGTQVYIVPLLDTNNTTVGEIDIDAITGKNLGGAGGAP